MEIVSRERDERKAKIVFFSSPPPFHFFFIMALASYSPLIDLTPPLHLFYPFTLYTQAHRKPLFCPSLFQFLPHISLETARWGSVKKKKEEGTGRGLAVEVGVGGVG